MGVGRGSPLSEDRTLEKLKAPSMEALIAGYGNRLDDLAQLVGQVLAAAVKNPGLLSLAEWRTMFGVAPSYATPAVSPVTFGLESARFRLASFITELNVVLPGLIPHEAAIVRRLNYQAAGLAASSG